jgi:molybdopterin synthase catalytic subunit
MTLKVQLFAMLRERAGSDSMEVELPPGATVADALDQLALSPELGQLLARLPVRMAVNREYASLGLTLAPGDELALIPPISGGAGGTGLHARISEQPLSADALSRLVADPRAGAIVCFQGVSREVARLDYEAYREMAETEIAKILEQCVERHGLLAAAAEHRIGAVPLGEPGVVVAVSAGHREEAFAGAREAIDRIKAEAPIWKREVEAGSEGRWVEGEPAPAPEATG